jgi:hypothetical protein
MATDQLCEYCDKRGVPILPLRYAVAPAGAGAPSASGPAVVLPASATHYTRRLLRSGYLYVFDEARNRWDDYFATADGYFFRLYNTPGTPPVLPQKPFNCPDVGHAAVASCITIPDAKRATKVWLGFSDVQWTDAVRARHQSAAYRQRHMRCVTVNAFASSTDKAHCLPIAQVGAQVAEYAMTAGALRNALDWSPFAPNSREGRAERLVQECERLHPGKGFAVVLDDPAGVAQELALLMKRNFDLFINQPEHQYGTSVDGVLHQMELAIKQQGERDRLMRAQREALNATNPGYMDAGDGGGAAAGGMALARILNPRLNQQLDEIEEDIRNVPGPELDKAADDAWAKYARKLNAQERGQWRQAFDTKLKDYDAKFVAPLATAHVQLLKDPGTQAQFECNFDPQDMPSGEVYTAVFMHCITATADKKACFDLYTEWLSGSAGDTKNLLLRALTYNHDPLASEIEQAAASATDWKTLPWDKLIEGSDKAVAKLVAGTPDILGRGIGMLAGVIAENLRRAASSPRVFAGLVALGVASRQPVVPVTIEGGRKAFRALLIRQLLELSGAKVSPNQMQRAVAEELRRLKMHGVPLEGTDKKSWLLMIDPAEIKAMPQGLSAQARVQWLVSKIRTPEDVEALNLGRFNAKLAQSAGVLRSGLPLGFGVLGVVANWVALDSVRDSERKAMEHNKGEGLARIYAQGAQLVGAVASSVETALAKMPAFASGVARGFQSVAGRLLSLFGRGLGVGGSLFMAGIDFYRFNKERQEGNVAGAVAYFVSGALGFAAAVLLFTGFIVAGVVVVVLMLVWAFVMTALVDNNLQDWMERCRWGTLTDQRYRDMTKELGELKTATQG